MSFATLNVMSLASLSVMILLRKSCDMIALLTLNCTSGHHNLAKPIITAPSNPNAPFGAIHDTQCQFMKACFQFTQPQGCNSLPAPRAIKQKSGQICSIPTLYLANEVFSYELRYAQRYEPRFAQRYDFASQKL